MEQQPNGVWLRDGDLIYMLQGTGEYWKGREIQRNKFEVCVRFGPRNKEKGEELTKKLLTFLEQEQIN